MVKLTRNRRHHINLGQNTYEWVEVSATVEIDFDNTEDLEACSQWAQDALDKALAADLAEAAACTAADSSTHAEFWGREVEN
jgi:hypothetical protein